MRFDLSGVDVAAAIGGGILLGAMTSALVFSAHFKNKAHMDPFHALAHIEVCQEDLPRNQVCTLVALPLEESKEYNGHE